MDSHPAIDLADFPILSSRSSATPNPMPSTRNYGTFLKIVNRWMFLLFSFTINQSLESKFHFTLSTHTKNLSLTRSYVSKESHLTKSCKIAKLKHHFEIGGCSPVFSSALSGKVLEQTSHSFRFFMEIWSFSDFRNIEEVFRFFSELSFLCYFIYIFFYEIDRQPVQKNKCGPYNCII